MSEEKLRNIAIKNKIQGICQDCIYLDKIVPIINEMTSRAKKQSMPEEAVKMFNILKGNIE